MGDPTQMVTLRANKYKVLTYLPDKMQQERFNTTMHTSGYDESPGTVMFPQKETGKG